MDYAGLEVVYCGDEGDEAEEFVQLDLEGVELVGFVVEGVAVRTDDEEHVEGERLPGLFLCGLLHH